MTVPRVGKLDPRPYSLENGSRKSQRIILMKGPLSWPCICIHGVDDPGTHMNRAFSILDSDQKSVATGIRCQVGEEEKGAKLAAREPLSPQRTCSRYDYYFLVV